MRNITVLSGSLKNTPVYTFNATSELTRRIRRVAPVGGNQGGLNYAGGAWANSTEDHTGARERSWNGGEGLSFGHPVTGDHFYIAADHLGTARGYYDGSKTRVSPLRRTMGKPRSHDSGDRAHGVRLPGQLAKTRCLGGVSLKLLLESRISRMAWCRRGHHPPDFWVHEQTPLKEIPPCRIFAPYCPPY